MGLSDPAAELTGRLALNNLPFVTLQSGNYSRLYDTTFPPFF